MPTSRSASRIARLLGFRALLGIALLGTVSGCSRLHPGDEEAVDNSGPSYVVFVNQALDQATVYAIGSAGDATRIGTVQPGRTETLTVPATVAGRGPVNFVARLLARSGGPQSGLVALSPGDRMQITLSPDGRSLTVLPAEP